MPQQLIYTSSPRGVIAGRSGYCTVARSATMRDALMLQLEKLSYYQHLSLSGGTERPIYCCRVLDIRGSRYHVLTRIQDAGLDFTGRTNFLAHHLVLVPEEIRQFASPPIILRAWSGWVKSWVQEPQLFETEDWSSLATLPATSAPATNWQQLTGDAANGYGLLEARAGLALRADNLTDDQVLALFAESLELLELRDARRDFRGSRWQFTFTTSMQEQDNPADFRWRCLHSDNPAANRFAGPDTRALTDVRATRTTNEEALFARAGRQPPRFVVSPQNLSCALNETARFRATAEGVPAPAYQWLVVDRTGNRQPIPNATSEELLVPNPPLGISRYAVRATNSEGEITSDVVVLSVEPKGSAPRTTSQPQHSGPSTGPHIKSADDIERQRQRLETERGQEKRPIRKWPFMLLGIFFLILVGATISILLSGQEKAPRDTTIQRNDSHPQMSNLQHSSEVATDMTKQNPAEPAAKSNPMAAVFSDETSSPSNSSGVSFAGTINPLPAPWGPRKIGTTAAPTWASFENDEFVIHGSGRNIGEQTDNFFFVQRPAANQVDFQARVKSADRKNLSRHGIMVRESIRPDAAFAFIGVSQTSIFWVHRDVASSPCQFINIAMTKLPLYLRLTRKTNNISSAYSENGTTWTWLGTNQITFSDPNYMLGMAVSSGSANSVKTVFDRVTVTNLLIE